MSYKTDDLRIVDVREVVPYAELQAEFPVTGNAARTTHETRQAIHRLLHGEDDRMLVIVGPCSIHDPEAALEYAARLKPRLVVDVATLTGAIVIALGHHTAGVMGSDEKLVGRLVQSGRRTAERLWPMPLDDEHRLP